MMMMKPSSWLMLLLGSSSLFAVSSQMVEYDLVEMPDFETDGFSIPSKYKYKVQCPAGGRCYLQSKTSRSFGPTPDFRDGTWSYATDESIGWYYFLQGGKNVTLEDMFSASNNDPYIGGDYCDENSTCSIICTDDCICGLEWQSAPECLVKQDYPDLVLPAPTERIIYEFLQDFGTLNSSEEELVNVPTMQLRCPDFLNGCYLDSGSFAGSVTNSEEPYAGFYAVDYEICIGDKDATIPCRLGCDPGCSCTILNRFDNTTEDCTMAPPTATPTIAPISGALGVGTWTSNAFVVMMMTCVWW